VVVLGGLNVHEGEGQPAAPQGPRGVAWLVATRPLDRLVWEGLLPWRARYRRGVMWSRAVAVTLSLAAPSLALLPACDAPCAEYWQLVCQTCGKIDSGCESAKARAKAELREGGSCGDATALAREVLAEPGGKKVVCNLPRKGGPPPKLLRGAWDCEGTPVELGLELARIGAERFDVVQFSTELLDVKVSSSSQVSCRVGLDGDRLGLRCAAQVGALRPGDVWCRRAP
jgi:hypothetical protein